MYFENFPYINYSLDGGASSFVMTDIFRRVVAKTNNILTATSFDQYDIKDGETPEILADKFYNDPNLHWVILVANEIIDPRWDWPLSQRALNSYITDKYGAGNEYALHHYVNDTGDWVHSSYAGVKYPRTNTDHENEENELKRKISILQPKFVPQFVQSFTGLLNNG